jgi:hypothetical protein
MLHMKSYPHERRVDLNTDLSLSHSYPCFASDLCCCSCAAFSVSLFLHPVQSFGCSFLHQGILFEIRGCMKPSSTFYQDCRLDGGGYLCQIPLICGEVSCLCCGGDQLCMNKYQCCCCAFQHIFCPSIIPTNATFSTICFQTTIHKTKDNKDGLAESSTKNYGWCWSMSEIATKTEENLLIVTK